MAISQLEYLLLDARRYLIAAEGDQSSFRRFHQPIEASQVQGQRVQSPFVDAQVAGFETGQGLATVDAEATGYLEAEGMEPADEVPTSGRLRLKVGRALSQIKSDSGAGGYIAFAVFNNLLYALRRSEPIVDEYDGSTFTARDFSGVLTGGALGVSMVVGIGNLLIGTTDNSKLVRWDGSTFTAHQAIAGDGDLYLFARSDASLTTWLFRSRVASSGATLYSFTEGAHTFSAEAGFTGMLFCAAALAGSTIYFAIRKPYSTTPSARIFSATDTTVDVGEQMLAEIEDNYPLVMTSYRGELYMGMAWGGSVRKLEGSTVREVGHFGAATAPPSLPGTDAVWALFPFGDSLYAAFYDSSAASGQRTILRRYRLDESGVGGWHTVSMGGNDASIAVRALGAFEQRLVLGDQGASDGRIYEESKTTRLTAASLTTPDFQFGAPALPKRFTEVAVQHDALLSGQAMALSHQLDGADAVAVGTNRDVGSVETIFQLASDVAGRRLRIVAALTNGTAQDFTLTSARVRMIPAPTAAEVWEATLRLDNEYNGGSWQDGTADPDNALVKYERLNALRLDGTPFQVVDPFRESGLPMRAMRGLFDPQVPLQWRLLAGPNGPHLFLPVRILQAAQPENLLLNASFEQDAAAAAPTSWGTQIGTGDSANVEAPGGTLPDGTKVLLLDFNTSATSYGREQAVSGLVVDRWYTLSGSIRRATTGGTVRIEARTATGGGGTLLGATESLAAATDSAYTRYEVPFQATATTVYVSCMGISSPRGLARFDAVQLEEGVPASTFKERGSGG